MESPIPSEGIKLASLGGGLATPKLAQSLCRYLALPDDVRAELLELVPPLLAGAPPDECRERTRALVERHALAAPEVTRALDALHFLVVQAAGVDLDEQGFAEDLAALASEARDGRAELNARYPELKKCARERALRETVLEHGAVLSDVDWRIDKVQASSHGRGFDFPLVNLTLHYREGERTERITLQAFPDDLATLRSLCDHLLTLGQKTEGSGR